MSTIFSGLNVLTQLAYVLIATSYHDQIYFYYVFIKCIFGYMFRS